MFDDQVRMQERHLRALREQRQLSTKTGACWNRAPALFIFELLCAGEVTCARSANPITGVAA